MLYDIKSYYLEVTVKPQGLFYFLLVLWPRASNENLNGLLQEFFTKGTALSNGGYRSRRFTVSLKFGYFPMKFPHSFGAIL